MFYSNNFLLKLKDRHVYDVTYMHLKDSYKKKCVTKFLFEISPNPVVEIAVVCFHVFTN